jgi:hypothetical protein
VRQVWSGLQVAARLRASASVVAASSLRWLVAGTNLRLLYCAVSAAAVLAIAAMLAWLQL